MARDTQVTWYPSGDPTDTAVVGYTDWLDRRAERPFQLAVWIDVRDGTDHGHRGELGAVTP